MNGQPDIPMGRLRAERDRQAAAERDQEAQVAKRLAWAKGEGRSVDQIAASLDWPGKEASHAGVLTVLRRLQRDGRARPLGDNLWTAAPEPRTDPDTTTPQEAPVKLADRIRADLAAHPWSTASSIASRLQVHSSGVSKALLGMSAIQRREGRRVPPQKTPPHLWALDGAPDPLRMPAGPAPAPPQPTPEAAPAPAPEAVPTKPPPEVASAPPAAHIGSGYALTRDLRTRVQCLRFDADDARSEVQHLKRRIRELRAEADVLDRAANEIEQALDAVTA